jgi:putative FmdB family regulatory protein
MPIYEYKCKKGHVFDVMQSINDDPVSKCEVCGSPVERVFHAPSVHFKGSGFYNTDYGTKKRARENRESASDSSSKESSSSSSSSSSSDSGSGSGSGSSDSSGSSDGGSSGSKSDSGPKKSDKAKASSSS